MRAPSLFSKSEAGLEAVCGTQSDCKHCLKTGTERLRGLPAATDGDRVGAFGATPLPFTWKATSTLTLAINAEWDCKGIFTTSV